MQHGLLDFIVLLDSASSNLQIYCLINKITPTHNLIAETLALIKFDFKSFELNKCV